MNFRTEISISPFPFQIEHKDKVMLMGSCFTQNIGKQLSKNCFSTLENPYGISFNPLSVVEQLQEILNQKKYSEGDLNEVNQRYISFSHHSVFMSSQAKLLVEMINEHIFKAHYFLKNAKVLFISLGTAWVWRHKTNSKVVNNCHKVPSKEFSYTLAVPDEIINAFEKALQKLNTFNPNLQVVFTVSPVRHWRNGALNNSRSKAILLTSVYQLTEKFRHVHYFPSFEIMMDDLRDYRFYTDDLLHPSNEAIRYIWQKFSNAFFSSETRNANASIEKIYAMQNHRHVSSTAKELQKFNAKLKSRIEALKVTYKVDYIINESP